MAEDPPRDQLDVLRTLLTTAQAMAADLATDPLVERILRAFGRLPASDRETVLGVIERDGSWCRIVEQTSETTGITVRPNPNASLYVHVFGGGNPSAAPLQRDVDVISFGIERFVHLLPLFFQEGVHAQWTASARDLIRRTDPELRGCAARLAREVLELLAEAPPPATS